MAGVPQQLVVCLFDEGVDSFAASASSLSPEDWHRPACGSWSACDLARHVATVADWYHDWLDRAEAGGSVRSQGAEQDDPGRAQLFASQLGQLSLRGGQLGPVHDAI